MVLVDHPGNFQTLYAHMALPTVHKGQIVAAGDVIGFVGSTGLATGPHLHFAMLRNGVHMDPQPCF